MSTTGRSTARRRAEAFVATLSQSDRIRLVSGRDFWNTEDLGGRIPAVMLTDGPHGLRKQAGSADHVGLADSVPATCFPVATVLASTWDPGLVHEVGQALGREARAEDVALLLGPGLNIKRHPLGGRSFEYFSEDPYVSGAMATALVRGVQSQGVGACPKHFAANNQETNRMVIDTIIDERTLREVYLSGFETVVADADPAAVMTAYNQVNGQFCSDHDHLLGDVLRGEWSFDGLVVSDWGGTNDRVAGLRNGLDLEMPGGRGAFDAEVRDALAEGRLSEEALATAAVRVVELALRWQDVDRSAEVDHEAHHALARRAAAAGTVLLTNDGILPLAGVAGLAVIGALAQQPRFQGAGSSLVNAIRVDTLRGSLDQVGDAPIRFAPGYDPTTGATDDALLGDAVRLAAEAEHVVLVLGLPASEETEASDRVDWHLPKGQRRLLDAVLEANPRTVVVLQNGAAVPMDWADRPAAVVEAYLGGQAGGSALAEVLLGRAEPGGRLAESIPARLEDLPSSANFPGHPKQVQYRERHNIGYRFHDTHGVPARFPFGHGLSFTTFELGGVEVEGVGTDLSVAVEVTNTGTRAGSQVIQVYVGRDDSVLSRPAKELKGFAKVHLSPAESTVVAVPLDRRSFRVWDAKSGAWVVEDGEYEVLVGTSSVDIAARHTVMIESSDPVAPEPFILAPIAGDDEFAAVLGRAIPTPAPVRPFTRISTMADLATTPVGAVLYRVLALAMSRQFDTGNDEHSKDMLDRVMGGLPLRSIALFAGLSTRGVDRLLAVFNGRPWEVLRGYHRPQPR